MRVAFAGTPQFAAHALDAILHAGHAVSLVLTQPDRVAGRGMMLQPSPVKRLAMKHGITVHQPQTLKAAPARQPLLDDMPAALIVAAYGLILPQAVLDIPRLGCINIHASLLPRWRGAAPIQRAILAGDASTGISIMQMDAGLDTGPILLQEAVPITDDDAAEGLHDRLATLGGRLIVQALRMLESGPLRSTPQREEGVTYAAKIGKAEAILDWRRSAVELERAVRAFNPFPGAQALLHDTTIKIWRASVVPNAGGRPGELMKADASGIVVACGQGAIRLIELQRPGARRLPADDFLRGFPLRVGMRFEVPGR